MAKLLRATSLLFLLAPTIYSNSIFDIAEQDLYTLIQEQVYRTIGLKWEPENFEKIRQRQKGRNSAELMTYNKSPCSEDELNMMETQEWLDYFPLNDEYFLKPVFKHNWPHVWTDATPERRQDTCMYIREMVRFMNIGHGGGKQGNPVLTPKTNEFITWLRTNEPMVSGNRFYDFCFDIRTQAAGDNPIGLELSNGIQDPQLKRHALESLDFMNSIIISPYQDSLFTMTMLMAGIGRSLFAGTAKPIIDLKQCAKAAGYEYFGEVSTEIDTYVLNLKQFFDGAYGLLSNSHGERDFSWKPVLDATNSNRSFPYEGRENRWDTTENLNLVGVHFLQSANEWTEYNNITGNYNKFSPIITEMSRWGLVSERDYVEVTGNMYQLFNFNSFKWSWAPKTNDFFGFLCLHQSSFQSYNLAQQMGGPMDTSVSHFGDKALIGPDGIVHNGVNEWRQPYPSQMPHAYYSQQVLYNSSMTEAEQLAVWNAQDFMKNTDDGCVDADGLEPTPFTSLKDIYPFMSKQMKWHTLNMMTSADKMFPTQGCRFPKIKATVLDIEFHKKLGFSEEVATTRAVIFSVHIANMEIVIALCNIIMLITGTNLFFHLFVGIVLIYLVIKTLLKLISYLGFDIVVFGRWIDDRQFYSKNNAQQSMKKMWPLLHVGFTDHQNYAWDLPVGLMRPEGGNYVYHCDILQLSAKEIKDSTLKLSEVPTAQSYLDMGHSRGSREDMQSVVLLGFTMAFFWYMLFNTGNFKPLPIE